MSSKHSAWMVVALVLVLAGHPLRAQTRVAEPDGRSAAKVARAVEADADPAPQAGAGDPLAPAEVDKPAPAAPGAPAAGEASTAAAEIDPVLSSVRERLAAMQPSRGLGAKEDLAGAVTFYAERAQPVWTNKDGFTARAKAAMAEIAKADDWGLKASVYELPSLPEVAASETRPVGETTATPDAKPAPESAAAGETKAVGDTQAASAIKPATETASPASSTTAPSAAAALHAESLAEVEMKLSLAVLAYARHARGGRVEPSSVSRKFDQKPVIFEPRSVLAGIAAAEAPDAYLRGLHPQNPQFEKLRQALLAARKSEASAVAENGKSKNVASETQILVNMERWRWMPPELGAFYVWDSIPDQMTYVIDGGRQVLAEKIVVGKLSSPTPIFSADMKFVIFHPSWGVPPGMKQHELLPQLRDTGGGWFSSKPLASSVLKAHGLRVTRGGVPIDPDAIDWNQVSISNFEFEQGPGPTNVLGRVKFRFPNKHDVYMHDTPERHLFGGAVRAFSHGCMRVQNPMHLAEVLLAHDKGWAVEEIQQYERRGGEVVLTTPIPVHVTYFTVSVDDDGNVVSKPDLYGLDGRTASAILGREVRITRAPVADAAPKVKRERSAQGQRSRRDRKKVAEEPKPFNPFNQLFGSF